MSTERIHAVADQLASEGLKPTLAAVRSRLGGGSFTTISKAMQEWRVLNAIKTEGLESPSRDVKGSVGELSQNLWHLIQQQIVDNLTERLSEISRGPEEALAFEIAQLKELAASQQKTIEKLANMLRVMEKNVQVLQKSTAHKEASGDVSDIQNKLDVILREMQSLKDN
jgi:TolA-binding protein